MENILYKIVRTYNLLLAIIPSIAFYRATVQPDYKWGLLAIHGKGMSTDYWYLLILLLFSWTTFILESWHKRKWYYFMQTLLFALVSVVLSYGYLTHTEMVFQGDAWEFKFDIGLILVLISLLLLVASIVWTVTDLKKFEPTNYSASKRDRIKLIIGLSMSILIFTLFAQGRGGVHTIFDRIAVGLTVVQALFISAIIDKTRKSVQQ